MAGGTNLQRALLIAVLLLPTQAVLSHGAGYTRETDATILLRFGYSTGEPMEDTDVVLTNPDGVVAQRARTDREGRYAFVADRAGNWSATADDGLGHKIDARIEVDAASQATVVGEARQVELPQSLLLLLLCVSALANVVQLVRSLRSSRPT